MQDPGLRGPFEILRDLSSPGDEETGSVIVAKTGSAETTDPIVWPEKIIMSGLPMHLWGYNTKFVKSSRLVNSYPEYVLGPYNLYYFIPIIGLRIFKSVDGQWIAQHYDPKTGTAVFGAHTRCIDKHLSEPQDTPIGKWSCGGIVKPA